MGAFPKSTSKFDPMASALPMPTGHPNPDVYSILRVYEANGNLVVWILCEGCTNYEGNKVLVFEACTIELLVDQGSIDPHFSDNEQYFSPIARFEPTERGWTWAMEWAGII